MAGYFNDYAAMGFSAVNFQIVSPSLGTESFSGKVRRVGQGHQYYTFDVKFPLMTSYTFGPIGAFIAKQYGQVDSWTIALPEVSYNTGTNAAFKGTPIVSGTSIAIGAKTCTIQGMVANKNQVLRAGDFFKFNNHSKVYMAVDDLNSGGAGTGTLNFAGSLVAAVPVSTGITIDAVPFTVILDSTIQEYAIGTGGMTDFSFKCREVW